MSKSKKDYRTYILATAKPTEHLDGLNRLGGRIYSKTLSLAFKTHEKKGFWLSDGGLKAYLKFKKYPCHAHSVQAIIDDYCGARRSFFSNLKSNPNAKPPHKTRKFHTFTWRATGISYKRGKLRLSMGEGSDPLWIKVDKKFHKVVPAEVSLVYNKTTKQYGKKANQKLHQWAFSKIQNMITYKAKAVGISVATEDEAYTSQTCPSCRHKKKPSGRTYRCSKCNWNGHRDIVGASNILTKYQGWLFNPVVGAVVSPTGVRFTPHLRRLDKWSPFSGLKSSKPPTRKQRSTRL